MRESERGVTLLEVLAAITILSIIAIVLMNSIGFTTSAFSRSDQKVDALRIAESELSVRLYEIETSSPLPNVCTTECEIVKTVNENGRPFEVTIIETNLVESPNYQYSSPNSFVSLQGISVMNNGAASEQRLLTVIVSWER